MFERVKDGRGGSLAEAVLPLLPPGAHQGQLPLEKETRFTALEEKVGEGITRRHEERKTGCKRRFGWERDKREENHEEEFSL